MIARVIVIAAAIALAGCRKTSAKQGPPSVSIATALRSVPAKSNLDLASSKSASAEPDTFVRAFVIVTQTEVSVLGDPWPIAKIPPDPSRGFAAEDKRNGVADLSVLPLEQAVDWAGREAQGARDGDGGDKPVAVAYDAVDVVIVADARTTYRILVEVVSSTRSRSVGLAVKTDDPKRATGVVQVSAPSRNAVRPALEIHVTTNGAIELTRGGALVGAACARNLAGLGDCLVQLAKENPELPNDYVFLRLPPDAPLSQLVQTIEVVHEAKYENVAFGKPTMAAKSPSGAKP